MEKVLTISIAAYNVEKFIRNTLDSLIDDSIIDDLEIFVVDDGGNDKTLEIAQKYADSYPQSIFPIHKENGGYGSTINTSIELATGKYFKQLDGDDWYQTENLKDLVKIMKSVSVDCVVTDYIRYYENNGETAYQKSFPSLQTGKYKLEQIILDKRLTMYTSAFRTSLLKNMPNRLTEHCFYTDSEYAAFPLPYIDTIYILRKAIYVYMIGIEGQSMNLAGIAKHYHEHEKVFWELLDVYNTIPNEKNTNKKMFQNMLEIRLRDQYRFFCLLPLTMALRHEIVEFTQEAQTRCPEILNSVVRKSKTVKFLSAVPLLSFPVCSFRMKRRWKKGGRQS